MKQHGVWVRRLPLLLALCATAGGCGISTDVPTGSDEGKQSHGLQIDQLRVTAVTDTTAVVEWGTTQPAVGTLRFSIDAALATTELLTTGLGTAHRAELQELEPSTLYYYRVTAIGQRGDTTSQRGAPFRTDADAALNDPTAPVISAIEVVGLTSGSAEIRWRTDDAARGSVYFGTSLPLEQSVDEFPGAPGTYARSHSTVLSGLAEGTLYRFSISATNKAALTTTTQPASFTTLAAPTLSIHPAQVEVAPGASFDLAVRIQAAQDLHGIALELTYDPSALEVVRGQSGQRVEPEGSTFSDTGGLLFMPDVAPGRVTLEATWTIEYANNEPQGTLADGDFTICLVHCQMRPGYGGGDLAVAFDLSPDTQGQPRTRLYDHRRLAITFRTMDGVVHPAQAKEGR
jgi:hypothetical protein